MAAKSTATLTIEASPANDQLRAWFQPQRLAELVGSHAETSLLISEEEREGPKGDSPVLLPNGRRASVWRVATGESRAPAAAFHRREGEGEPVPAGAHHRADGDPRQGEDAQEGGRPDPAAPLDGEYPGQHILGLDKLERRQEAIAADAESFSSRAGDAVNGHSSPRRAVEQNVAHLHRAVAERLNEEGVAAPHEGPHAAAMGLKA